MRRLGQAGQTLIALLIFMMVATTVTLAAAAIAIINIQSTNAYAAGSQALANADSGVQDAVLQLQRDPSFSGETLSLSDGSATITISGSGPITITSVGTSGHFSRTVTAQATLSGSVVTLTSESETP